MADLRKLAESELADHVNDRSWAAKYPELWDALAEFTLIKTEERPELTHRMIINIMTRPEKEGGLGMKLPASVDTCINRITRHKADLIKHARANRAKQKR